MHLTDLYQNKFLYESFLLNSSKSINFTPQSLPNESLILDLNRLILKNKRFLIDIDLLKEIKESKKLNLQKLYGFKTPFFISFGLQLEI